MRLTVLGLAIGFAAAAVSAPVLRNLLFGIGAFDPWTFGLVSALLSSVALLASYVPARRASRVEPLVALRHE
jgi:putative ABC transport system permease protein